mgnify:CR=1 FL=1
MPPNSPCPPSTRFSASIRRSSTTCSRASCTAATTRGLAEGEYKNGKVLAEFQDKGVQADQIPRDVLLKLKEVTQEVLEEEASKDADFKRVYESQQEFMESYKVWDTRAYVPADL